MECDRYAAVRCGGGVTPSCAPLTWGSLECCRVAAFLRLLETSLCPPLSRSEAELTGKWIEYPEELVKELC